MAYAFGFVLYVRIAQAIFAAIGLALAGYVHHCNHEAGHTDVQFNSENNFLIFVPIFGLVSLAYLEISARFTSKSSPPKIHLVVEFLNAVFFFCGFIVMAKPLADSKTCHGSACDAMKAETVFAAFNWVLWSGTTILALVEMFKRCCGSKRKQQDDVGMKQAQVDGVV